MKRHLATLRHSLALSLIPALTLAPTSELHAQGSVNGSITNIKGLPFEVDPSVNVASPHFNTNNNGVRDFGEWDLDTWGAGSLPDLSPAVLVKSGNDPQVFFDRNFDVFTEIVGPDLTTESLTFDRVVLDPSEPRLQPDLGHVAIIFHPPTRVSAHPHNTADTPVIPSPFNFQWFLLRGASLIVPHDTIGYHPYRESLQSSIVLGRYLKAALNMTHVLGWGVSYGAAIPIMQALADPGSIDGALCAGGAWDWRSLGLWNALWRPLARAEGALVIYPLDKAEAYSFVHGMGQFGMTPWSFDLHSIAGMRNIACPITLVMNDSDIHTVPGTTISELQTTAAAQGLHHLQFELIEDAGHGGLGLNPTSSETVQSNFWEHVTTNPSPATTVVPLPRSPQPPLSTTEAQIANFISEDRVEGSGQYSSTYLSEVWRTDVPQDVGASQDSAVIYNGDLIHGDSAGFVTRRTLTSNDPGQDPIDDRTFVGMEIRSMLLDDVDGDGTTDLVVGHTRGVTVLDPDNLSAPVKWQITEHGRFDKLTSGLILPGRATPQVAGIAGGAVLAILDGANGATLHTQDVGELNKIVAEPNGLLLAMPQGHVARVSASVDGANFKLTATHVSDYLQMTPIDFCADGLGHLLVVGGEYNDSISTRVYRLSAATLTTQSTLDMPNGALTDILPVGPGQAWVAGIGSGAAKVTEVDFSGATPVATSHSAFVSRMLQGDVMASQPGSEVIGFRSDRLTVYGSGFPASITTPIVWPDHGRMSAVAFYKDSNGWEVSALETYQQERCVDPFKNNSCTCPKVTNGTTIHTYSVANPSQATQPAPIATVTGTDPQVFRPTASRPRQLVRFADDATQLGSFHTFAHSGYTAVDSASSIRLFISMDSGRLSTYANIEDYRQARYDAADGAFIDEEDGAPFPCGLAAAAGSTPPFYAPESWGSAIDLYAVQPMMTGAGGFAVASTANGKIRRYDGSGDFIESPTGGFLGAGLAIADVNADGIDDWVYGGSMLNDGAAKTLRIYDTDLGLISELDVGLVSGIAAAGTVDLDDNPATQEIVVGCANGDIVVVTHDMFGTNPAVIHRENLGTLSPGRRNAMAVMQENDRKFIGLAVDGGVRVLEVFP